MFFHIRAGFENRNDVIAPNRSATRSDLLAAFLLSIFFFVLEEEILSREANWRGKDTLILLPSRLPSRTETERAGDDDMLRNRRDARRRMRQKRPDR